MIDRPMILASGSPRRRELMTVAGYAFDIVTPSAEAECGVCSGESPPEFAARMAYQKAADVATRVGRSLIVACDTIAECNGQILGKPENEDHARHMLTMLRGRRHHVYSGLCLWQIPEGEPLVRVAKTTLFMQPLTDEQLEEYLASGLWEGKSGSFGYQDRLGWLDVLDGSESNVVGLPMELLAEMLAPFRASSA
ncbi:MAG: septum formation protein Maf [Planctomycetaceae bacterium]|nr:septum formation protein Maf [Planctomycetaceae bacterium]